MPFQNDNGFREFGTSVLVCCITPKRYNYSAHTKPMSEIQSRDLAARGDCLPRTPMRHVRKLLIVGWAAVLTAAICPTARAQINSNVGTVVLNASMSESLFVNVTGGPTVNFALAANTAANPGSTTSTILTGWTLKPGRTRITLWAWVANGAAALTDGVGDNIPASAVSAAASGSGSAGGALNTVASGGAGVPAFITPAAATGVQIGQIRILGFNKTGSSTTTLTWNINTTVVPQLPAATYTGTVNIQAQALP